MIVPSLLNAIVRLDGQAMVMHVGDKPYVVTSSGQTELATRGLTFDAVSGMAAQLLPDEWQKALDEFGAVQYEFPPSPEFPGEHFTVVAARGGDDMWLEIRRRFVGDEFHVPQEMLGSTSEPRLGANAASRNVSLDDLTLPEPSELWGEVAREPTEPMLGAAGLEVEMPEPYIVAPAGQDPTPLMAQSPASQSPTAQSLPRIADSSPHWKAQPAPAAKVAPPPELPQPAKAAAGMASLPGRQDAPPAERARPAEAARPIEAARPLETVPTAETARPPETVRPMETARPVPHPAVVVPMARSIRPEPPTTLPAPASGLDRLVRLAAARGASTLYLSSQTRPSVRVDGEIQILTGEATLSPSDVESLLIDLMPERNREALRSGVSTEWICEVPEVGRLRCLTFRDHRGAGGIFRMMPVRAISAEQLGLSREIQALAAEAEGLVLIAGPRSSGKSTLISAVVDLINRTRQDHVITIESEIKVVHEQRRSLISQREVRGSTEDKAAVARAALREDPDVLVFEELRGVEFISLAMEASASGHLVIAGLPAHTATGAVDRIIDAYPPGERRRVQLDLAENLRGIVAQVLVRKTGGGRIAAREVLLNTPAVSSVIAEGKTSQLTAAMEGGRKYGMVPLNDGLVGLVQAGVVEAREAYRQAADRAGFLALLKRHGVDTSFVERLA